MLKAKRNSILDAETGEQMAVVLPSACGRRDAERWAQYVVDRVNADDERMKTSEAIEICESWFAHIERQKQRSIEMQKIATMARNGQQEEAQRRMRQMDSTPTVYDGARLEPAVRHLVRLATGLDKTFGANVGECPCKGHPFNCFDHPNNCGCTGLGKNSEGTK